MARRLSKKARKKLKRKQERKVNQGNVKSDIKKAIKEEQLYICFICGEKGTDRSMNIHHKHPKSKGGSSGRHNLVAWHITCHNQYHREYGLRTSDDKGCPVG